MQGFVVAIDHIDEVITILRSSRTVIEGKQRLIERFKDMDLTALLDRAQYDTEKYQMEQQIGLSDEQADAIVQMRLGQLTGMERQKVTDELYQILAKISDYLIFCLMNSVFMALFGKIWRAFVTGLATHGGHKLKW